MDGAHPRDTGPDGSDRVRHHARLPPPLLHTERGLPLAQAGLLASAPNLGLVFTLIAWGALADRIGEKWVIVAGLALTALASAGVLLADGTRQAGYVALGACFLLGGMAAASTSAASGRIVVGWFPKNRRGLVMGIRQMCQPLGTTIAAVTVPSAAQAGIGAALLVPLVATAVLAAACALWVVNPPRPAPAVDASSPRATTPTGRPDSSGGSTSSPCCWSCRSTRSRSSGSSGWSPSSAGRRSPRASWSADLSSRERSAGSGSGC
ncbi:MFS transporter [Naasia aerilata]|uniref:Major facilitator superfamily (MFS) profile domain-containing protein n=1 Tax=Naasia aerilata TaxID=1162966 RepID=A0ABM8GES2_9MICO|nr:MFS transporter [Naasia aerilata]BDZ46841.1 hypothetical protein GCM10025866_27500 [Naasia aerilata]